MKTRSFAVDLLLLASIFFSTSCAAPTPTPSPTASQTPPATQTPTPAATQTPAPTATETPISVEFIPLNVKSTEFSETKEGVTTKIVLSVDKTMAMRAEEEKLDELVKNDRYPGGSNEAMNAFARGFLYETAILTNENANGMTEDEYLNALAYAQENPNNEDAWKKVEINIYDDATKSTKSVRFTKEMTLDIVFVNADQIDGLTITRDDRDESVRNEFDTTTNTLRIIRGVVTSYSKPLTSYFIAAHLTILPNLLALYKGERLKGFENPINNRLIKLINIDKTITAFKAYYLGKPVNNMDGNQNP